MKRIALTFLVLCVLSCIVHAQSEPQDPQDSTKWESAIAKFETSDEEKMPPEDAILFVGSSSIRLWDLPKSFPDRVTINRGFGGSHLADSVHFIDRIVLKYKPKTIVMYAGDNDIAKGKSPERVFADFAEFVAILQKNLPETTLHYISIKPSIKRWNLVDKMRRTNQWISSYCDHHDKLHFVDIWPLMMDEDGTLISDLFVKDGLHLSKQGYQLWSEELGESLKLDLDCQSGQTHQIPSADKDSSAIDGKD